MNIKIIAVGKLKEKYLADGVKEFLKRLGPYAKIEVIEVADEKAPDNLTPTGVEAVKAREAERIKRYLKPEAFKVALAIEGEQLSSPDLAALFASRALAGKSDVTFIIGGSLGLHRSVLDTADMIISFGPMTFPHQLMRLILAEQIYRAYKINRGEPYHK